MRRVHRLPRTTSPPAKTSPPRSRTSPPKAEEAVGEDRVIKGTVLKLTATHVVVDVGAKSEGMLPLSEVLDHEGKPKVKPGDEIDVMREKGQTEEGYINLSHQKARAFTPGKKSRKPTTRRGRSRPW